AGNGVNGRHQTHRNQRDSMKRAAWIAVGTLLVVSPLTILGDQQGAPKSKSNKVAPSLPEIAIDRDNIRITTSVRIKPGLYVVADTDGNGVLQIAADNVTVDFRGAILASRKNVQDGEKDKYDGIGVAVTGKQNVVLKNAKVHGYLFNVQAEGCRELRIEGCDLSHSRAQRIG